MIGIVDSDLIVYRCGFASERSNYTVGFMNGDTYSFRTKTEMLEWFKNNPGIDAEIKYSTEVVPPEHALQNVNTAVKKIKDNLDCPCEFYLTGKNNYRNDIATILPYKGNRSPFAKPRHYDLIREHLVNRHGAKIIDGWEADDECRIRVNEIGVDKSILVSNDKDLDMQAGFHYNWVTDKRYEISERQGDFNFAAQVLTGDKDTDNIPGIPGVGPKTAAKLLAGCTKPSSLWGAVYRAYFDAYGPRYDREHTLDEALLEIARLIWLKKSRDEPLWSFPT